jgi:RNA polymerase sigma factor (sigma-70 family)
MPTHADRLLRCVRRIACQTSPETADSGLLTRFLTDRDPAAFEALVDRHGPMVLRVCQHVLGNRHDAEDAFQATFLVLARKAASVRPSGCLAAWLHGVACRVALRARTAARRQRRESLGLDLAQADPHPDPLAELTAREALRILEEEVQRLPEAYRLPVVLCCLHGISQEEAARQLGWTPGSVKGRLERGRQRLHQRLAGRGLGLTTALALVEVARATAAGPGEKLVASTALAAAARASGNTAGAGLVSAEVKALAEGALTHGTLARVKVGILLFIMAAIAVGLAALGQQLPGKQPSEMRAAAEPSQAAPEGERPESPKDKEQTRTDRNGDPLPTGAVARLGSARLNQGGPVAGLAFSPNGKVVASCGGDDGAEDRAIHLWDVATGKEVTCLRGDKGLYRLSFSPDGKLLASGGLGSPLRLWDLATGKEQCRCGDETPWVSDLAFSPDGKLLAALCGEGEGHSVTLWDTATGKMARTWKGAERETWSLAFSPDGATLATAGAENALHLWDVANGSERRRIEVNQGTRWRPLAFSPDGQVVALGNPEHTIRVWDPATGRELPALRGHKAPIKRLLFSAGGKTLISASEDRTIRFWDMTTARELKAVTISGEGLDCWVMAISPDEKVLAAGGTTNTIHLFDATTGKQLHPRDGHVGRVEAVGFLPQGDLVASVGWLRVVRLAETATGKERQRSANRPFYGLSMVLSPSDGRDHLVFSPVALSRDSSLVAVPGSASDKGKATVRILEVTSDREVGSLTGDFGNIICLAFSPDKKTLALAGYDRIIRVWDTAAHKEVGRLTGHEGDIYALDFSPDGQLLASGCTDQTVRVWDLATGKEVYQLRHDSGVHAVAFSPDGRSLASAGGQHLGEKVGDTSVRLWELATGQERGRLSGNHHLVLCLAFAADGKILALGSSDGSVRVWDPLLGKELRCFEGHRGRVNAVAFSRDGKRLVSGSTDTTVLIWDTAGLASPVAPTATVAITEREALWRDLAGADAGRAYRAMRTLHADGKESVRFLKDQLKPVPPTDSRQIARWVADLDAEEFAVRERATVALTEVGELAEPALRRILADRPSLELRRRVEALLGALAPISSPEQLRALRAVEVLEQLATPEARELLTSLARGAPEGRLTRAATAALERLKVRP